MTETATSVRIELIGGPHDGEQCRFPLPLTPLSRYHVAAPLRPPTIQDYVDPEALCACMEYDDYRLMLDDLGFPSRRDDGVYRFEHAHSQRCDHKEARGG